MPTVPYLLYDVFTDVPFTGNPLAVAIDPPELTTEACATMAAELGLPETIFLRTNASDIRARIFTPTEELPFAGHPTIGAAIALRDERSVGDRLVIVEGVGPVEVTIDDGLATLTTARPPTAVDVADPATSLAPSGSRSPTCIRRSDRAAGRPGCRSPSSSSGTSTCSVGAGWTSPGGAKAWPSRPRPRCTY